MLDPSITDVWLRLRLRMRLHVVPRCQSASLRNFGSISPTVYKKVDLQPYFGGLKNGVGLGIVDSSGLRVGNSTKRGTRQPDVSRNRKCTRMLRSTTLSVGFVVFRFRRDSQAAAQRVAHRGSQNCLLANVAVPQLSGASFPARNSVTEIG